MDKKEMIFSVRSYLSNFSKIGKREEIILEAMEKVDRKDFMLLDFRDSAYLDTSRPSGMGQTISQPSTVARMLQLLDLYEGENVLEIGTGSGWNLALIGYIVGKNGRVLSIEVVDYLIEKSSMRIKKLGIRNVEIKKMDFRELKERFDKIIFTCGIKESQEELIYNFARSHLKEKGILVCPHEIGNLIILKMESEKLIKSYTEENYVFVPLILD